MPTKPASPTRKPMPPRRAASLLIIDHTPDQTRVLMGKRNATHDFMPNVFVFPGGRIEPADRRMNIAGPLPEIVEQKIISALPQGSAGIARALALASIRETFEETGFIIGDAECGTPEAPPEGAWSRYAAHGVYPNLEGFHFIARAVTPAGMPKRFDTIFFAVGAHEIIDQSEGAIGPTSEFTALEWVNLDDFGDLPMSGITRLILAEMKKRLDNGMSYFLPVPSFGYQYQKWTRQEI
jgi:8-oxo-dGTP pyrophosphatase MutT (NUDIX family)